MARFGVEFDDGSEIDLDPEAEAADEGGIKVELGDEDADGIVIATTFDQATGRALGTFETTQAEMKAALLEISGFAVPQDMYDAAKAAQAKRLALGRTNVTTFTKGD